MLCCVLSYPVPQAESKTVLQPFSRSSLTKNFLYLSVLAADSPMYSCQTFAALPSEYWSLIPEIIIISIASHYPIVHLVLELFYLPEAAAPKDLVRKTLSTFAETDDGGGIFQDFK